jgi:hypothetical protein
MYNSRPVSRELLSAVQDVRNRREVTDGASRSSTPVSAYGEAYAPSTVIV